MGEWTQFEEGDRAPNDGEYIEIGEDSFPMGISNPKRIRLRKGQPFPKPSRQNRKWTRFR